jgi:hypothetical protein
MIPGGIALTVAGTRQLSGYIDSITVGESSGMPPGFMFIVFGTAFLCFAIGYITGEMMKEYTEINQ